MDLRSTDPGAGVERHKFWQDGSDNKDALPAIIEYYALGAGDPAQKFHRIAEYFGERLDQGLARGLTYPTPDEWQIHNKYKKALNDFQHDSAQEIRASYVGKYENLKAILATDNGEALSDKDFVQLAKDIKSLSSPAPANVDHQRWQGIVPRIFTVNEANRAIYRVGRLYQEFQWLTYANHHKSSLWLLTWRVLRHIWISYLKSNRSYAIPPAMDLEVSFFTKHRTLFTEIYVSQEILHDGDIRTLVEEFTVRAFVLLSASQHDLAVSEADEELLRNLLHGVDELQDAHIFALRRVAATYAESHRKDNLPKNKPQSSTANKLPLPVFTSQRSAYDYVNYPLGETRPIKIAQSELIKRDMSEPGIMSDGLRASDLSYGPPLHANPNISTWKQYGCRGPLSTAWRIVKHGILRKRIPLYTRCIPRCPPAFAPRQLGRRSVGGPRVSPPAGAKKASRSRSSLSPTFDSTRRIIKPTHQSIVPKTKLRGGGSKSSQDDWRDYWDDNEMAAIEALAERIGLDVHDESQADFLVGEYLVEAYMNVDEAYDIHRRNMYLPDMMRYEYPDMTQLQDDYGALRGARMARLNAALGESRTDYPPDVLYSLLEQVGWRWHEALGIILEQPDFNDSGNAANDNDNEPEAHVAGADDSDSDSESSSSTTSSKDENHRQIAKDPVNYQSFQGYRRSPAANPDKSQRGSDSGTPAPAKENRTPATARSPPRSRPQHTGSPSQTGTGSHVSNMSNTDRENRAPVQTTAIPRPALGDVTAAHEHGPEVTPGARFSPVPIGSPQKPESPSPTEGVRERASVRRLRRLQAQQAQQALQALQALQAHDTVSADGSESPAQVYGNDGMQVIEYTGGSGMQDQILSIEHDPDARGSFDQDELTAPINRKETGQPPAQPQPVYGQDDVAPKKCHPCPTFAGEYHHAKCDWSCTSLDLDASQDQEYCKRLRVIKLTGKKYTENFWNANFIKPYGTIQKEIVARKNRTTALSNAEVHVLFCQMVEACDEYTRYITDERIPYINWGAVDWNDFEWPEEGEVIFPNEHGLDFIKLFIEIDGDPPGTDALQAELAEKTRALVAPFYRRQSPKEIEDPNAHRARRGEKSRTLGEYLKYADRMDTALELLSTLFDEQATDASLELGGRSLSQPINHQLMHRAFQAANDDLLMIRRGLAETISLEEWAVTAPGWDQYTGDAVEPNAVLFDAISESRHDLRTICHFFERGNPSDCGSTDRLQWLIGRLRQILYAGADEEEDPSSDADSDAPNSIPGGNGTPNGIDNGTPIRPVTEPRRSTPLNGINKPATTTPLHGLTSPSVGKTPSPSPSSRSPAGTKTSPGGTKTSPGGTRTSPGGTKRKRSDDNTAPGTSGSRGNKTPKTTPPREKTPSVAAPEVALPKHTAYMKMLKDEMQRELNLRTIAFIPQQTKPMLSKSLTDADAEGNTGMGVMNSYAVLKGPNDKKVRPKNWNLYLSLAEKTARFGDVLVPVPKE